MEEFRDGWGVYILGGAILVAPVLNPTGFTEFRQGYLEIVRSLLDADADANLANCNDNTPLWVAAWKLCQWPAGLVLWPVNLSLFPSPHVSLVSETRFY